MKTLVSWLIAYAMRTPYFHLFNPDGTPYMERYWLIPFAPTERHGAAHGCYAACWWRNPIVWLCQRFGIAVRIHHIQSADLHRDLHDHPWWFVSVVLRGWYVESLPLVKPVFYAAWQAKTYSVFRKTGSVAFRGTKATHTIERVPHGGVWTLFITGPWRQQWGFYTEQGWVNHVMYKARHNPANEPAVRTEILRTGGVQNFKAADCNLPDNNDGRRILRRVKS